MQDTEHCLSVLVSSNTNSSTNRSNSNGGDNSSSNDGHVSSDINDNYDNAIDEVYLFNTNGIFHVLHSHTMCTNALDAHIPTHVRTSIPIYLHISRYTNA